MTSDVASSAGGGDLSDFEYDSSLYYEPSGSETGGPGPGPSLGGGHNLPVDPFSNIASLGARMNVPDTIALLGDDEMHNYRLNDKLMVVNQAANMSIPDRISLDGSVRDSGPGFRSNLPPDMFKGFSDSDLVTPPRRLKLDDHHFPSIEPEEKKEREGEIESHQVHNPSLSSDRPKTAGGRTPRRRDHRETDSAVYNDSVFEHSSPDVIALRKQVLTLSRKLVALEQDNRQRAKRENYLVYSVASLGVITLWLLLRR